MKILNIFFITVYTLLASASSFAQMENWEGVDLGRICYKHNSFEMNMTSFQQHVYATKSGSQSADEFGPNEKVSIGSIDLSFEMLGKNAYFFVDASMIPNLIQGAVMKDKLKTNLTFESGNRMDYTEFIPMRVAFGGPIAKYFGLYVGGQYMYSSINTMANDKFVTIGGNQRGAGAHVLFGKGPFLFRYSYMYDWVRRDKRVYKGIAITNEASLAFNFGNSGVGLIARAGARVRKMDADFGEYDESTRDFGFMPSLQSVDKYFTIGIFAAGLFSGTTYSVTKVAEVY